MVKRMHNTKLQEWSKDEIRSIVMECLEELEITSKIKRLEERSIDAQEQIFDHSKRFLDVTETISGTIKNLSGVVGYLAEKSK